VWDEGGVLVRVVLVLGSPPLPQEGGHQPALVSEHLVIVVLPVALGAQGVEALPAAQTWSSLAEGGGPHAVLVHVVLLQVALGVGVAEVLIVGFVDLYLLDLRPTYLRHVYHAGPGHAPWTGLVQLRLVQPVVAGAGHSAQY